MPKEAVFTIKLEPELRDAFLREKVAEARGQVAAGQFASADDVEARFAVRRAELLANARAGSADE